MLARLTRFFAVGEVSEFGENGEVCVVGQDDKVRRIS